MLPPDISVIITTQQKRDSLFYCLNQALKATNNLDAELIIVKFKGDKLLFNPPRTVKVLNASKKTAPEKRNLGLSISKSKFIHFLDDDDFVSKNFYTKILKILINDKNSIGVACSVLMIDNKKRSIRKIIKKKSLCNYKNILVQNRIGTTSSVILKKEYLKNQGFRVGLKARQDFELWLRLLNNNPKNYFHIIPDILIRYSKDSPGSINSSTSIINHISSAFKVVFIERRSVKDILLLSIGALRYSISKIFR
jgi:hypothetical protein